MGVAGGEVRGADGGDPRDTGRDARGTVGGEAGGGESSSADAAAASWSCRR